jgi:ADP-dependent NAD(P)H-hydrate dehydratase / NAD(P)H-hydrate epimerase
MTTTLPLYTATQVRELDRTAIEVAGIPGYTLMSRAGAAAWEALRGAWPEARRIVVVCGTGNNGGDGYVLARHALEAHCDVLVMQLGDAGRIGGDARTAREAYLTAGGAVSAADPALLQDAGVIVDALLGTGLERPLEGEWLAMVEALNRAAAPVLAIDIPSGLHADSGAVLGAAVKACRTMTFIGRKQGLYTGQAAEFTGAVMFSDLGVPAGICQSIPAPARLVTAPPLGKLAAPRPRAAHKGAHGHVLVIGGDHGMNGAVRLAGEAALRVGAGLVSLATRAEHAAVIAAACPELMSHGVGTARELFPLLARATVVVVGPGLGRSSWARSLFAVALDSSRPLLVDADALNLLSRDPLQRDHWVLTPHPGEAGRLLQQDTTAVQQDRYAAVRALGDAYGGVVVLKGAGTLVYRAGAPVEVCPAGNPGMATGGMGDVLSGVIAGLIAQGLDLPQAATAGVCLHAQAGDRAAAQGERGMTARDVIGALRAVINTGT